MNTSPIDLYVIKNQQLPLYWLADDWGRWESEADFLKELKWAIIWNDIVFVPDDFILTNRYFRKVFAPAFPESLYIAQLFLDGTLRIVVRDLHTGYNSTISNFEDATHAILSDANFAWPREVPKDDYIMRLNDISKQFVARPLGLDINRKFQEKLLNLSGLNGASIAHEYYKSLFLFEAKWSNISKETTHDAIVQIAALANYPHIRRSLLYQMAENAENARHLYEEFDTLFKFPKTLRAIGDDIFLHNLMENFLPIATFPEGKPTPIWLDSGEPMEETDIEFPHQFIGKETLLPHYTGMVVDRFHELSFQSLLELKQSQAGIEYRKCVANIIATQFHIDATMYEILHKACSAYLRDIAKKLNISVSSTVLDNYILKWKLLSPASGLQRLSLGLIVQSIGTISRTMQLFSRTLPDSISTYLQDELDKSIIQREIKDLSRQTKKSHQHMIGN